MKKSILNPALSFLQNNEKMPDEYYEFLKEANKYYHCFPLHDWVPGKDLAGISCYIFKQPIETLYLYSDNHVKAVNDSNVTDYYKIMSDIITVCIISLDVRRGILVTKNGNLEFKALEEL